MLATLATYCSGQNIRMSLFESPNINDRIEGVVGVDFILDIANNVIIYQNTRYINPILIVMVEKI